MAGKSKAKAEDQIQKPSSLEGQAPAANADAAVQPPSLPSDDAPAANFVRLRADHAHRVGLMTNKLRAGQVLSSADYDFEKLMTAGAQLDLIDFESGEVLADLNEM